MQILQETQKHFIWLGLDPQIEPIHDRLLSILTITCPAVISQWIYLIDEAHSPREYMESIYVVTTCTGILVSYASTIVIRKKLFSFVKSYDEFTNESK